MKAGQIEIKPKLKVGKEDMTQKIELVQESSGKKKKWKQPEEIGMTCDITDILMKIYFPVEMCMRTAE